MDRKEEVIFNDGIWFVVQELVTEHDEPTLAKDILRSAHLRKKEMRRCQKKSGFLDKIMYAFINSLGKDF